MKKIYPLLLISFLLFNVSCSKEEDSNNDKETTDLAGEWQMEAFEYNSTTTVKQGDMTDQSSYSGTGRDINFIINFNAPDNTWESSGDYVLELVTQVNGETEVSEESYSNITGTGTYSVNGNILSLSYDEEAGALAIDKATISKLTESELVLEFEYSETSVISGFEVELVVNGFQIFSR